MYKTVEEITSMYSIYKKVEKRFRQSKNPLAEPDLITFTAEQLTNHKIQPFLLTEPATMKEYQAYEFEEPNGFVIIKNYLPVQTQIEVALMALNEFPSKLSRGAAPKQPVHL